MKNRGIDSITRQFRDLDSLLKKLAVVALLVLIVCMVSGLVRGREPQPGRYQLGTANGYPIRMDTATGEVHSLVPKFKYAAGETFPDKWVVK